MVQITRLNGECLYVNPHLIESIEQNPDTTITLSYSKKLIVKETAQEVIDRIIDYRRRIGIGISDMELTERMNHLSEAIPYEN